MKPAVNWIKPLRLEPILFWVMVLIGTLPVLFNKYYVTMDGPSHLYNGYIIKELLLDRYSEYSKLFAFNPIWVPNWMGHFLFALLGMMLPDYLTEKVVILAYLILTPYFFRKICLHFNPENKFLSYLMIPFAHNHLLYMGFFNFCLAITLLLATVAFVLKVQHNFQIKHMTRLALLLLLVYFSHVMVVMITIGLTFLLPLNLLSVERKEKHYLIRNSKAFWKSIRYIALSTIPVVILLLNYLTKIDSLEQANRMEVKTMLKMIVDIRPLITLSYSQPWVTYNRILFSYFLVLILGNFLYSIKRNGSKVAEGYTFNYPTPRFSWIWLILSFLFTFLFLIANNANLLLERLILIVYLFFILGIAILKYPKALRISALFFILFIQIIYLRLYMREMRNLSVNTEKIKESTRYIDPGSLLLPFKYSSNWLDGHLAGYLGSGKPIVVLENYEGNLSWFPLIWNMKGPYQLDQINSWGVQNRKIAPTFYTNPQNPAVFSLPLKDGKIKEIPYVIIFGQMPNETDEDYKLIKPILDKSYTLVFENESCHLYRIK